MSRRGQRAAGPPWKARSGIGGLVVVVALVLASAVVAGVLLWREDGEREPSSGASAAELGPVHVHGLGVNPADRALYVATHTGLYRAGEGERKATRVGEGLQDTMGFTIVGPDRFLGSGHPDVNAAQDEGLPPLLGLIESTDAGRTWQPISLLGQADFHVLRFAGERIYGYDASNDRLLSSADRGRSWDELKKPGAIVDLAVSPLTPGQIVVASSGGLDEGLFESRNGGRTWKRINRGLGLLAWPAGNRLHVVDGRGDAFTSTDGGRSFEHRGAIGGRPAALVAQGADELYVALHDGTIKRSTDGGASWVVRSSP